VEEFIVQPLLRSPDADAALEQLLHEAYVPAGFTDPNRAAALFRADAVHARGHTLAAQDASGALLGTVTLVPGASAASLLAVAGEVELHLLAVWADARGRGIGEALVAAVLREATTARATAVWLWTQPAMQSAQRLYERLGFRRVPARDFRVGDREFLVFSRPLTHAAHTGAA